MLRCGRLAWDCTFTLLAALVTGGLGPSGAEIGQSRSHALVKMPTDEHFVGYLQGQLFFAIVCPATVCVGCKDKRGRFIQDVLK